MNDPVGGVFAALALIAAFIAMIVTFFMACASGNWGPFGDCWACILFFGIIGASLGGGKRRQPVHYCRRCGSWHALPLGPKCPR